MALPTSAARKLACGNCRQWILKSFLASVGVAPIRQTSPPSRAFSIASTRRNEARERLQKDEKEEFAINDINEDVKGRREEEAGNEGAEKLDRDVIRRQQQTAETELDPEIAAPSTVEHVPWYLRVESPIERSENAVSERQRIPDLPANPPALLEPLLQRISVELGMDDLSFLDLRGVDPPPALGANLLMIIGTARSEKHLHFSADKLCRWLRTEHHLRPIADGLLGRQELKLKLRRRAKRSRLLSAVGAKATADTELDEGIRTGWICVNVGRVEGGDLPKSQEQLDREKNIVGFGTTTTGSQIVVQLLTEEKRGEMDLEKLWATILRQAERARAALMEPELDEAEDRPAGSAEATNASDGSVASIASGSELYHPLQHSASRQQHVRAYHTSARILQTGTIVPQPVSDLPASPPPSTTDPDHFTGAYTSLSTLNSLLASLETMQPSDALGALGTSFNARIILNRGSDDESPADGVTAFVHSFNKAMPPFPGTMHWHACVQLICQAFQLDHPNCNAETIKAVFQHMQSSNITPYEVSYITALVTLLKDINTVEVEHDSRLEVVFDLLEEMETLGYNAIRPEVLELLHHTIIGPPTDSNPTTLQSLVPALGLARLKRQLASQDLERFWRTWHSYPRRLLPRQAEMYVVLFDALAKQQLTADFRHARELMSAYTVEMEVEEPAILVEREGVELAMSVYKAMRFADPDDQLREWDGLRERCERVLRATLGKG